MGIDILEKMYADSQAGHPLFEYAAFSELTVTARITPVTGDAGYGGWIFLWTLPRRFCIDSPASRTEWLDDGLTPFAL